MKNKNLIAYTLLGLGALMFFNNPFTAGLGWFWVAAIAAFVYWEYKQRHSNGLLLASTSLTGLSAGIMLEHNLGLPGFLFLSLAFSILIYKKKSKDKSNWLDYVIMSFAALGLLALVSSLSIFNSSWLALILVAAGVYLIYKKPKTITEASPKTNNTNSPKEVINKAKEKPTKNKSKKTNQSDNLLEVSESDETASTATKDTKPVKDEIIEITNNNSPSKIKDSNEEIIEIAEKLVRRGTKTSLSKRLKNWRKAKAIELAIKETAIISNISLKEISSKKPQDNKELLAIKGIGKVKLERYGQEILKIIKG